MDANNQKVKNDFLIDLKKLIKKHNVSVYKYVGWGDPSEYYFRYNDEIDFSEQIHIIIDELIN